MNKKAAIVFLSVVLGIGLFPVTALADPVEESGGQITGVIEQESTEEAGNESESAPEGAQEQGDPAGNEAATPTQETEEAAPSGTALTPDGNLTLVDDYSGVDTAGKQFITLSTRSGNIFYLIIDRDDEGNETVHFLNQVDEEDLFALMDEDDAAEMQEEIAAAEAERQAEEAARAAQETADQEETPSAGQETERAGVNPVLLALPLLLVFAGVAGYLCAKAVKGRKKPKAADPDEGYFDDDDPEVYDLPEEADDSQEPVPEDDPEYWPDDEE